MKYGNFELHQSFVKKRSSVPLSAPTTFSQLKPPLLPLPQPLPPLPPLPPQFPLQHLNPSSASSTEDTQKWMERDEKAHGIIQDHISDALLIKTRSHKTAKALFDALIEIHQIANLPTTFYAFWQLFSSTWDGTSPISDHITSI